MSFNIHDSGWSRITPTLDVEVLHGVPVRVSNSDASQEIDVDLITEKIREITGLSVSMNDWQCISADEHEWSVCINKEEFEEVLHRLALSSAAMFVDRFHKAIDPNAVDWDDATYNVNFKHAREHCCISWGSLNKNDYFEHYIADMHNESLRLINAGISPYVEAE